MTTFDTASYSHRDFWGCCYGYIDGTHVVFTHDRLIAATADFYFSVYIDL